MYGGGGLEAGAVGEKPTAMWGHSEECRVHPGQVRGQIAPQYFGFGWEAS